MAFFGRGKNKIQNPHTMSDMYKFYMSDKEEGSPYVMSSKEYKTILRDYIKEICKQILEGRIFYMPYGMGSLSVNKRKVIPGKRLSPDWESILKYGKLVLHLNEHTNGYKYSFRWDKEPCKFKHHKHYRLVLSRQNKRSLARYIKDMGYDYVESQRKLK